MTTEWKELRTLQEVAAAQAAGEEVEVHVIQDGNWQRWEEGAWYRGIKYRSRPRKQTNTVVLREGLCKIIGGAYWTGWFSEQPSEFAFVRWLDTPERTVEVELP